MSHLFVALYFFITPLYRFCNFLLNLKSNILVYKTSYGIVALLLPMLFSTTSASASSQLSDKGQQTLQQCVSCHGSDFNGNMVLNAPALAGQSAQYMSKQIINYQQGLRGTHDEDTSGQQMAGIAKSLENKSVITEILHYLSELNIEKQQHIVNEIKNVNLRLGSNYYQGKCGACHGINAQGNDLLHAPRLNHLSAEYIAAQMVNFSGGVRGTDSNDKYGRQMALMAKTSSGQELVNIIAFIQTQGINHAEK